MLWPVLVEVAAGEKGTGEEKGRGGKKGRKVGGDEGLGGTGSALTSSRRSRPKTYI